MLVSYSDSEGSDDEQPKQSNANVASKQSTAPSSSNFAVDKSTGKIRVNLYNKPEPSANGLHDDERAPKRPRLGGSNAFSGFNALLPAPKRDKLPAIQNEGNKTQPRKVFSLRTGAEPAFSRESDAELRELFAEQDTREGLGRSDTVTTIPSTIPKPSFAKPAPPAPAGKPFMFKPLSVARNTKKKKPIGIAGTTAQPVTAPPDKSSEAEPVPTPEPPKKKINLFSADSDITLSMPAPEYSNDDEDEVIEDLGPAGYGAEIDDSLSSFQPPPSRSVPDTDSLASIATDLNLTPSERRQLFGRSKNAASSASVHAVNVINFNTDAEYAANQQLIAAGETVQHNPVRAIASGKHSLRQLVGSAVGQKEALEESFATGRRNKKEAGSKYGW